MSRYSRSSVFMLCYHTSVYLLILLTSGAQLLVIGQHLEVNEAKDLHVGNSGMSGLSKLHQTKPPKLVHDTALKSSTLQSLCQLKPESIDQHSRRNPNFLRHPYFIGKKNNKIPSKKFVSSLPLRVQVSDRHVSRSGLSMKLNKLCPHGLPEKFCLHHTDVTMPASPVRKNDITVTSSPLPKSDVTMVSMEENDTTMYEQTSDTIRSSNLSKSSRNKRAFPAETGLSSSLTDFVANFSEIDDNNNNNKDVPLMTKRMSMGFNRFGMIPNPFKMNVKRTASQMEFNGKPVYLEKERFPGIFSPAEKIKLPHQTSARFMPNFDGRVTNFERGRESVPNTTELSMIKILRDLSILLSKFGFNRTLLSLDPNSLPLRSSSKRLTGPGVEPVPYGQGLPSSSCQDCGRRGASHRNRVNLGNFKPKIKHSFLNSFPLFLQNHIKLELDKAKNKNNFKRLVDEIYEDENDGDQETIQSGNKNVNKLKTDDDDRRIFDDDDAVMLKRMNDDTNDDDAVADDNDDDDVDNSADGERYVDDIFSEILKQDDKDDDIYDKIADALKQDDTQDDLQRGMYELEHKLPMFGRNIKVPMFVQEIGRSHNMSPVNIKRSNRLARNQEYELMREPKPVARDKQPASGGRNSVIKVNVRYNGGYKPTNIPRMSHISMLKNNLFRFLPKTAQLINQKNSLAREQPINDEINRLMNMHQLDSADSSQIDREVLDQAETRTPRQSGSESKSGIFDLRSILVDKRDLFDEGATDFCPGLDRQSCINKYIKNFYQFSSSSARDKFVG